MGNVNNRYDSEMWLRPPQQGLVRRGHLLVGQA